MNELIKIWENEGENNPKDFLDEYKERISQIIKDNGLKEIIRVHDKDDKFKGAYKVSIINKKTGRLFNNKVCYANEALAYMSIIYGIIEKSFGC